MTPKEKAKELVDKYMNLEFEQDNHQYDGYFFLKLHDAKDCALIAVDEILNIGCIEVLYWLQVKTEIEAL